MGVFNASMCIRYRQTIEKSGVVSNTDKPYRSLELYLLQGYLSLELLYSIQTNTYLEFYLIDSQNLGPVANVYQYGY